MRELISSFTFKNTVVRYLTDESKRVELQLIPRGMETLMPVHRERVDDYEIRHMPAFCMNPAIRTGSLVQLRLADDPLTASDGMTMSGGSAFRELLFKEQHVNRGTDRTEILTVLEAEKKYQVHHRLTHYDGENGFEITTEFVNISEDTLTLDMLTSFSLDNLSPFQPDDQPEKIVIHRFRSGWSLEGKHCRETLEELHLERSWAGNWRECERFGMTGSHVVNRFFPFCVVEDREYGVFWGAALEVGSSWQMELEREFDGLRFSGGLADYEMGHWEKHIGSKESFTAPKAYISCVQGSLDDLCYDMTYMYHRYADRQPAIEQDMPIVFNEYCSTWGAPTADKMYELADCLKNTPVKYLVMDAGWSKLCFEGQLGNGDWLPDETVFPDGVKSYCDAIRKRGLIPGIWFEMEVTSEGARVYEPEYDDLKLKRNGRVISIDGNRKWWDFRKKEVVEFLEERVIHFLRDNGFGYLKVDYNRTIGIGCDGAESLGEGLRQHMEAVRAFFRKIREEVPGIIIENCASGGHRTTPFFVNETAMTSFSDAHECREIPLVAFEISRMILPRSLQVWSVLRADDTYARACYNMSAGFLGRWCFSGDFTSLSEERWNLVRKGMNLYRMSWEIIKYGKAKCITEEHRSFRNPRGIQVILRTWKDRKLVVYHSFDHEFPAVVRVPLPGKYQIIECLNEQIRAVAADEELIICNKNAYEGTVILLEEIK